MYHCCPFDSAPSFSPSLLPSPLPPPLYHEYMYSVWFNTARVGLVVGLLGWFLNFLPYLFVPARYDTLSLYVPCDILCIPRVIEIYSKYDFYYAKV